MNSTNRGSQPDGEFTEADYRSLLEFRDGLRAFLHWSEQQARRAGLTGAQHQLLLAIHGHGHPPSVGEIADHLLLRHHSVVELVDRAAAAGLVERVADDEDQRVVRVTVTPHGEERLRALSVAHVEELSRVGTRMRSLWDRLPERSPDT